VCVQCGRDHAGNCIIFINYAPLISNAPRPLSPIFPLHHSANANTSRGAGQGQGRGRKGSQWPQKTLINLHKISWQTNEIEWNSLKCLEEN